MSYGSYPIRTPIGGVPRVNAGDISPLQPPELGTFEDGFFANHGQLC